MRALMLILLCLATLAGGVVLGALCVKHPVEVARAWDVSSTLFGVATTPPPTDQPDDNASAGGWTPPKEVPAQPNWTWHTPDGKTYENVVITSIKPTEVVITHSLGVAHLSLDALPAEVQRLLQYTPPAAPAKPPAAAALTPIAAMVNNKLVDAAGQTVATPGPAIKFYAIYYSAGWCPPCHAFTPTLVDWYKKFKPLHHDFELIFVSEDRSEPEMYAYMQEMQMPWPAVRYADLPRQGGTFRGPDIEQFANDGIPDLVLVNATGKVLADSFNGSNYLGPQSVVDYMNDKLGLN